MKCKKCGEELGAGMVYCPKCGTEAQIVSDQSVLEDELLRFLIEDEALQGKQETDASAREQKKEKDKKEEEAKTRREQEKAGRLKKKKRRNRIILIVIIAACAAAAVLIFRHYKSNTYDALFRKAQIAYNTGDNEEAEDYLARALEKEPASEEAYLLLGKVYVNLGETDKAEECFLTVIALNPDSADAYTELLKLYSSAGDYASIVSLEAGVDSSRTEILALFDNYIVEAPEASVEGGSYNASLSVELVSADQDEIYYTTDGTDPELYGVLYEEEITISEEGETTLLAVCINEDGFVSEQLSVTYEIAYDAPDMPTATPDGGQFTEASTVTLSAASGTTIYYTWDGSTPTTSSSKYKGALDIPEGNNVLSAVAVDDTTGKVSSVMRSNFIYYPE